MGRTAGLSLAAALIFAASCGTEPKATVHPAAPASPAAPAGPLPPPACAADWTPATGAEAFGFCLAPKMVLQPGNGVDSYAVVYWTDAVHLTIDYGSYTDPLEGYRSQPEYREETVTFGGRDAKLIEYHAIDESDAGHAYHMAVYFDASQAAPSMHLGMWVNAATSADLDTARATFASVTFR